MKLHLEITGKCNLNCVHCYNNRWRNNELTTKELSHEQWLNIIKEGNSLNCERFNISGGEPLMYSNSKFELFLELINECKAPIILLTNGHLLTADKIKELTKSGNLIAVRISLDGLKSHNKFRKGSDYKKVIDQIKLIQDNSDLDIGVVTMLNNNNLDELIGLYKQLKILKIDRWNIDIPFYVGNYRKNFDNFGQAIFSDIMENIKKLIKFYIKDKKPFQLGVVNIYKSEISTIPYDDLNLNVHPCSYSDMVCVKPDGSINPCAAYDFKLSNVIEAGSLSSAIKKARTSDFYSIKICNLKGCVGCRYIKLCGGGCRADAKYLTGSDKLLDPICCSLWPLVEEKILPVLPLREKTNISNLIDIEGNFPRTYKDVDDILMRFNKHKGKDNL